ncbi:MAG: glucose-6-phosphate isomerase [Akkermansiaceae bacterium]|nr:glucose-6-phosphate isomerase [Akkermansiaceae bacterium]MCP5551984.1 glucose-6-phosphate isomerase [Akkermansiaceae bacterium]
MPDSWERFHRHLLRDESIGLSLDISRMRFDDALFERLAPRIERAWADMAALEAGEIANPDENRRVGHYWLRNPDLASEADAAWIRRVRGEIERFAAAVHAGEIAAANGNAFRHLLLIGIGGSALGPQLAIEALAPARSPIDLHSFDNTDPAGFARTLERLGDGLAETLVIVASKSGRTPETRNGMLEAEAAFARAGIDFARHAVAVTCPTTETFCSILDDLARERGWLARFELADWIGGRTSVTSAVGLLPAALAGVDIGPFLDGAAAMDAWTRRTDARANPAMLLALMWHHAGNGRGEKDMVILPYCDGLGLLGKYLQQLVMESLGKALDRDGNTVHQGIAVYGNKGSTDQHAYIQQLRDGLNNFFATFIEVRDSRPGAGPVAVPVDESGAVSADYLQGFLRGTREALSENGRESLTLSLDRLDARRFGSLLALFERAVSFYASLVNVNAYHQPGVEAGKKAAGDFLGVILAARKVLEEADGAALDAAAVATAAGPAIPVEAVYHALTHLAATRPDFEVKTGATPAEDTFFRKS